MKIHDPNSTMVLVQNLKAGMRVEPGFLAEEETVIEQDAHPYNGDAVWVLPS